MVCKQVAASVYSLSFLCIYPGIGATIGYCLELIISNAAVYNMYRLLTVVFFGILYSRLPFMNVMRRAILLLVIFYCAFFLVNFTLIQPLKEQSSYMLLPRSLVVSLFAAFFLFRYFHLDEHQEAEYWSPWVWITTGIIVFIRW